MSRRHDDQGAALVLALAFVTVVSIGITALLTLADTGQRTTGAVREQGSRLYSASGAVDRAITAVRQDLGQGVHGGPCTAPTTMLNGVATSVTCSGQPGSGVGGGGGANTLNTPPNAVLTLAGTGQEDGLVQESNNELRITGPVVSNNDVEVDVSTALLKVEGKLSARGTCSPNAVSDPERSCGLGTAPIAHSGDPAYGLHPGAPAGSPPPDAAPEGCPVGTTGARYVRFRPGTYRSAAALNGVFTRCSGGVFHFTPGFYYFEFPSTDPRWEVTGSGTRVVGGVPQGWAPPASPGDPAPTVPFPAEAVPATLTSPALPAQPGGCVTSATTPSTPGVQLAFGGDSRWFVQDAKVELCARGSATSQQIAVYGLPPARDTSTPLPPAPVQQTVTYTASATATASGSPLFSEPDRGRLPDGTSTEATGTSNSGSTASLLLSDFSGPAIPAGATIDAVRLRVVHRPLTTVPRLQASLTTSSGGTLATVGDVSGGCSGATTAGLCRTATSAAYDQRIPLSGSFASTSFNGLRVRFDVDLKAGGTNDRAQVDGIALEISYTPAPATAPPAYRQLTGCHSLALTAGGCPLLETVGGPTGLSVHGTVYAPTAALRLELSNVGSSVIDRGLVVEVARIRVTGSSAFTGSPISLPPLGAGLADRRVTFVARQAGDDVLRAVVTFDDDASDSPQQRADVISWSVLR